MSLYHLVTAYVGVPMAELHYPTHLLFVLLVLFGFAAVQSYTDGRFLPLAWDIVLIGFSLLTLGYLLLNAEAVANRLIYATPLTPVQIFLGTSALVVVIEAARRTIGWALVFIALFFILYAKLGNYLPDPFWHRGFSVGRILEQSYMTQDGIWNIPIAVTANYIFLFVLLGSLLLASGAGSFFTEIAHALAGRTAGGPAKTAVVSSALMGMLSGSSPANVVTTGSFTIPAMKKAGFPPHVAAGIEAVASAGGQLTPPIMGAAAFIMAEFIGVTYVAIIGYALIPAILYFVAVFAMVDLESRRLGILAVGGEDLPSIFNIMRTRGYLIVPVVVMLYFLVEGYTPTMAGFWSIITLITLITLLDAEKRRRIHRVLFEAFVAAPKVIGPVSVASAIGGILAGIIVMTGLGVRMSGIILDLSGGIVIVALFLSMVMAIILGMGLPTAPAYIVLAVILAPGLIDMGVPEVAAHMFMIYSAAKSSITPPVAVASFAAAAVAGTDPWRTSLSAFKLGISVFIIPYMFVYGPALLGFGSVFDVMWTFVTAILGILALSVASIGWFRMDLRIYERLIAFVAALLMIYSGRHTDLAGFGVAALFIVLVQIRARRQVAVSAD